MPQINHSRLMTPIAERLAPLVASNPALRLYCDHIERGAQPAHSFFDAEHHAWSELSTVDILIADATTGEALWIVEVEEPGPDPKRFLGDVYAVALAGQLAVGAGAEAAVYRVTPATELLVCFAAEIKGAQRRRVLELGPRVRRTFAAVPAPLRLHFVIVERWEELAEAVVAALSERLQARQTQS